MSLIHYFSLIIIYISFTFYYQVEARGTDKKLKNDECVRRIYKDCNNPITFTDEELENVRQFLNYTFTTQADIKPDKPLCNKLKVRQNWKCLTEEQKEKLINVWKQMYENGMIQELIDFHVKYWPHFHVTPEFVPGHRWHINQFEKRMQSIDPSLVMPYWDPHLYGSQPERSSIWQTFGHSGNHSNGYSVTDGFYSQIKLDPPIKRHWLDDGKILPWQTPELLTMVLQSPKTFLELIAGSSVIHFSPHLNIGGYEGQFSVKTAPYDVLFYLQHIASFEIVFTQYQLSDRKFLTPNNDEFNIRFDPIDGRLRKMNMLTDTLSSANDTTIRELYWLGFGDMCYISDVLVRPINNKIKGIPDPIPTAVNRLPEKILEKYFPLFNSGNYSALYHFMEEVGDCNTVCHPIPKPIFLSDTDNGIRQLKEFGRYIDYITPVLSAERKQLNFWLDLNNSSYCSPYVTTY